MSSLPQRQYHGACPGYPVRRGQAGRVLSPNGDIVDVENAKI